MLIFAVLAVILLGFFCFGLVLFTDFRGIASHYSARNRATVERLAREGHDAGRFLVFGRSRLIGTFIMLLTGFALVLCVLGALSGEA